MADRLLTDQDVADRIGVSRVTVWRYAKSDPEFPKPLKLSPGTTRFRAEDLERWIESKEVA